MNVNQFRLFKPTTMAAAILMTTIAAQAAPGQTYSGEATVIDITDIDHPEPVPIVIADTGTLGDSGGVLSEYISATNVYDGALTLKDGVALTAGLLDASASEASLDKLTIEFTDMSGDGVVHTLTARSIVAGVAASCAWGVTELAGGSEISDLVIDGQPITVTGEANQTNSFNGFTVVLNEQSSSSNADSGEMTVTAIHITENGCMNAKLVTVNAGITFSESSNAPHHGSSPSHCGRN